MSSIVLIGSDGALLEGLAQTLAAAGHRVRIADSTLDGVQIAAAEPPLVAVVERDAAVALTRAGTIGPLLPLAPGGSLVLYHGADGEELPLPPALQRITLADLVLPLERHRLVALVHSVDQRAQSSGRDRPPATPEERRT